MSVRPYAFLVCIAAIGIGFSSEGHGATSRKCNLRSKPRLLTVNPKGLFNPLPFGFSHIRVDTYTLTAHVAGQVALNKTGGIVGDELNSQFAEVSRNMKISLKAVGAGIDDLISVNSYIVGFDPTTQLDIARKFGMELGNPVNTLISISGLAIPGLLVEIEFKVALRRGVVKRLVCA